MSDPQTLALLERIASALDAIRADMRKQSDTIDERIGNMALGLGEVMAAGFNQISGDDD